VPRCRRRRRRALKSILKVDVSMAWVESAIPRVNNKRSAWLSKALDLQDRIGRHNHASIYVNSRNRLPWQPQPLVPKQTADRTLQVEQVHCLGSRFIRRAVRAEDRVRRAARDENWRSASVLRGRLQVQNCRLR
jgi:hypothetical protein